MLAIKFQRVGKKHQPSYRVVVAEKRSKMISPPVEQVGFYIPKTKYISVEGERVKYWLGVGAKPTTSVHNLLVKQGVISGPKIRIKIPAKKVDETAPAPVATVSVVAPVGRQAAEESPVEKQKSTEKKAMEQKKEEAVPPNKEEHKPREAQTTADTSPGSTEEPVAETVLVDEEVKPETAA